MSYGLFNWWWGEDDVIPNNEWEKLSVHNLEFDEDDEGDEGMIAQISGANGWLGYDSRFYALGEEVYQSTEKIKKEFGEYDWIRFVESHPDVAKQMQEQPVLIYFQEEFGSVIRATLKVTEAEFKELFVFWEGYEWWILKSPELNRAVGRILKKNSPEKMAEFADSIKEVKA